MIDLYTVTMSVQQRVGRDVKVSIHASEQGPDEDRKETFTFEVIQLVEPDDLLDWLRRSLAAVVDAL